MTHRQFLLLDEWDRQQWNEPSRTDHYLMQLALEVRYSNRKRPDAVSMCDQMESLKLPFTFGTDLRDVKDANGDEPQTVEEAAAKSKSRWGGRGFSPGPPKGSART